MITVQFCRWLSFPWLLCFVLLSACVTSPASTTSENTAVLAGNLPVSVPEAANVNSAVEVVVGPVSAPDGTPVTLTAIGSYGARLYEVVFQDGAARFTLPPEETQIAGVVTLVASAGEARGEGKLTLLPGPPVDPLTPLVGARTIVANGSDWSMTVIVPFDRFNNPVLDGTPLLIRALHPGERLERQRVEVRNLLAWARIYSGTRAGRTRITVAAADTQGPEAMLLEVAGWPEPFALSAEPRSLPANGQDLMTLRTDGLVDQFGNIVPDGTLVTFIVESPDREPYRIPSYTVNGEAEAQLQAPTTPGHANVRAVVGQVESKLLRVRFTAGPAVGAIPVVANVDPSAGAVIVNAGPLLGRLEQYIPDGTAVKFSVIRGNETQEYTTASENGVAMLELRLAELPPDDYTVEVTAGSGRGFTTFTVPTN